jgi:hypothetical protein
MFMRVSIWISILILILGSFAIAVAPANADRCEDADEDYLRNWNQQSKVLIPILTGDKCIRHRKMLPFAERAVTLKQRAESACGSRLTSKCDSSCLMQQLNELRRDIEVCERKASTPVSPETSAAANRFSETTNCSSATLGQQQQCIAIDKVGNAAYVLKVAPGCSGRYFVAFASTNEGDVCERDVASVRAGTPVPVYSYFHPPRVLDAIASSGLEAEQCYRKRHKGGPC